MASKAAYKRLTKEYVAMQRDPPPFVWAAPDEKNILNWNYIIRGPPDSPYAGGEYYGLVLFPPEYPFKPPGIKMVTPSGRFQPDKKICFSMSDFHPGSWNPAWSVATILTGLLSFMLSDEITTGSVTTTNADKKAYASRSHAWNLQHKKFKEAFPDYCDPVMKDLPNMAQKERGVSTAPSTTVAGSSALSSPITPSTAASTGLDLIKQVNSDAADRGKGDGNADTGAVNPKDVDPPVAQPAGSRALSWGQMMWEKWYWGVVIAVALAVSSRLSGAS